MTGYLSALAGYLASCSTPPTAGDCARYLAESAHCDTIPSNARLEVQIAKWERTRSLAALAAIAPGEQYRGVVSRAILALRAALAGDKSPNSCALRACWDSEILTLRLNGIVGRYPLCA